MVSGGLFIVIVVVVLDFFFDVVEVGLIEGNFHESRQSGRTAVNPAAETCSVHANAS